MKIISLVEPKSANDFLPRSSLAKCANVLGVKAAFLRKLIDQGVVEQPFDGKWVPGVIYEQIDRADRTGQHKIRNSPKRKAPVEVPADKAKGTNEQNETIQAIATESRDVSYHEARTANEVLKARALYLKTEKLRGNLVDKRKAIETVRALAQQERDMMINFSARYGSLIASELGTNPTDTQNVIDKYMREHLNSISQAKFNV